MAGGNTSGLGGKIDSLKASIDALSAAEERIEMNPLVRLAESYKSLITLQREMIREGADFVDMIGSETNQQAWQEMSTFGEKMFGSTEAGLKPFKELAVNMKSFIALSDKSRTTIGKTAAVLKYMGFETKQLADLMDTASLSYGKNADQINEIALRVATLGRTLQVSPQEIAQNFETAQKGLAYSSKKMMQVFAGLQTRARTTGVEFSKLMDVFGDQMDTFEGSSKRAGQLNQVLGKSVFNSVDLLRKTESERLETIITGVRRNLRGSVNDLGKFELKMIASGMGLTVDETRRLLLGKTSVKEALQKRAIKEAGADGPEQAQKRLQFAAVGAAEALESFERMIPRMRDEVDNLKVKTSFLALEESKKLIKDKLGGLLGKDFKDALGRAESPAQMMRLLNKAALGLDNTFASIAKQAGGDQAKMVQMLDDRLYGGKAGGSQKTALDETAKELMNLVKDSKGRIDMTKLAALGLGTKFLDSIFGPAGVTLALGIETRMAKRERLIKSGKSIAEAERIVGMDKQAANALLQSAEEFGQLAAKQLGQHLGNYLQTVPILNTMVKILASMVPSLDPAQQSVITAQIQKLKALISRL